MSSARLRMTSLANRVITATRSATSRSAHATWAARARSTAATTSSAVPAGISASGSPVKTSLMVDDGRLDGSARNSGIATRSRRRSYTRGAGRLMPAKVTGEYAPLYTPA